MSFAIKKNNEVTYISQNSATSSSDTSGSNISNSVLLVDSSTNLTTSSPNIVILYNTTGPYQSIVLPNITSSNNGLTFTIRYYGTSAPSDSNIRSFNDENKIYLDETPTNSIAFNIGLTRTLVAYNSFWYSI